MMNSHHHHDCQSPPRSSSSSTSASGIDASRGTPKPSNSSGSRAVVQEDPSRGDDEICRTIRVVSIGGTAATAAASSSASASSNEEALMKDDAGTDLLVSKAAASADVSSSSSSSSCNDETTLSTGSIDDSGRKGGGGPLLQVDQQPDWTNKPSTEQETLVENKDIKSTANDKKQQEPAIAAAAAVSAATVSVSVLSESSPALSMFAAAAAVAAAAVENQQRGRLLTPYCCPVASSSSSGQLGEQRSIVSRSKMGHEITTNKTSTAKTTTCEKQPPPAPHQRQQQQKRDDEKTTARVNKRKDDHPFGSEANHRHDEGTTTTTATTKPAGLITDASTLSNADSAASALLTLSNTASMTIPEASEQVEQPQPSVLVSDSTKTGTLASVLLLLSSLDATDDVTPGKGSVAAATAAAASGQANSNVSEASQQQQQQQESPRPAVMSISSSSSQQQQQNSSAAAATDGVSSSLSSTTTRKQLPPPTPSSSSVGAKKPPSRHLAAVATRNTTSPAATRTVTAQQQRHGPREAQSFADARPCLEHAPTLDELQSQSFSDYVHHTVLLAALPRYRPEQQDEDIAMTTATAATSRAPVRASKKQQSAGEKIQSDAKNSNANGGNSDNDSDDEDEKVVIVEPDWTIQPMPLTQGMAKITLPPGFWGEEGIGQDTTGRGPAWQAGTALGDLRIHSPIQQHVRGMAGIYEYTFMDHTSAMTMADFRKSADDYQETQIPISLSLRKATKKTAPSPSKKKPKNSPAATSSATIKSASATPLSARAGTVKEEATSNADGAVQKSSNDEINNTSATISAMTSPSEMEVDPADVGSKTGAGNAGDDVREVDAVADEHNSDDDEDPAVHEYSNERIHKLEEKFWKRLGPTMSPAIYGADQEGTLFGDDPASGWSLDDLDSCLHVLPKNVPGVTSPYLYVGMWASVFCAHAEDMNLLSINYLHAGAPKIWYAIAPGSDAKRFESLCEFHFLHGSSASAARPPPMAMNRTMGPSPSSRKRKKEGNAPGTTTAPRMSSSGGGGGKAGKPQYCKEFLRHKRTLLSPKILQRAGIRYTTTIQRPGDAIITFPSGYHFGFNLGFNVAEATNFAVPEWIPYGLTAKVCMCRPDSVRIDMARLIQLLQLYQKDLAERVAAAKRRYKDNGDTGFLSWKEWRQLREEEKEKRQSKKKKKQRFPSGCGIIGSSNRGGRMNLVISCSALSDDQKSDQQRRNEFWVEVVKPVAKKDRPQVQLMSLADQQRKTAAAKIEEQQEEPIILEGKRKRKKSAKAAALEQEEKECLLEKQQREQHESSTVVESTQAKVQTAAALTNEIWHLAKPIIIPATGARNKQRRHLEVYTRVLCLLPGTVMSSGDYNTDADADADDDEEEDEQCFAGQIAELSDDHALVRLDGLPRTEEFWLPINSPKLFLDGGRWKDDDNMVEGEKGAKKSSSSPARGLPKLHYWQEIDSKDRDLSNEEND